MSDLDKQAMVELMTNQLRRTDDQSNCRCAELGHPCILRLNADQGWALYEMSVVSGLLASINTGGGKTGIGLLTPMVIPNCRVAMLLVPPQLVEQTLHAYEIWAQHWKVPTIISGVLGSHIQEGRPVLHVVPYSKLSRAEATDLMKVLRADTIISDECDKLRHFNSARTFRVMDYATQAEPNFCAWSGTLSNTSITDYAHLAAVSLKDNSPLPHDNNQTTLWAGAIDPPPPGAEQADAGALAKLCEPHEDLHQGYQRRLRDTMGVVITEDSAHDSELILHERIPSPIPGNVLEAIQTVRDQAKRPDGIELFEAIERVRCARELACGFYYRWLFDPKLSDDTIKTWMEARRAWNKEVRTKLANRVPYLDSKELLKHAAERFIAGERGTKKRPVWNSVTYAWWKSVKDTVTYKNDAVWLSDYLVDDTIEWGMAHTGIIWYAHSAFGQRVCAKSGLPFHGGGPGAGPRIRAEKGDRSIVASIKSHGTGRDGLQRIFDRQLVANPPNSQASGGAREWEQLFGRLHRKGQESKRIHTWMYRNTDEIRSAWDRALEMATYVNGTIGSYQKLLACRPQW